MRIGIELGWQAVRIVTIGTGREILSVSDGGDPAIVSTPPVVAQSDTGALVGAQAIDITGDESALRTVGIAHAFAPPHSVGAGAGPGPGALAILLEKAARDLRAFGRTTTDVTFIVSEEIIPRNLSPAAETPDEVLPPRNSPALAAFEAAATLAGFESFDLAYRAEAAAIHGKSLLTQHQLALAGDGAASLRAVVVDAGLRAVRLTVVDLRLVLGSFDVLSVNPGMNASATALQSWIGTVPPDRTLEFDLFGHFAKAVAAQIGDTLPPSGLDRLWAQIRDPATPDIVAAIDSAGRRQRFDVGACRATLQGDVEAAVRTLLRDLPGAGAAHFVFLIGHLAALSGMEKAVEAGFGGPSPARVFITLPAHGLASAARFDSLLRMHCGPLVANQEERLRLARLPINDGELDPLTATGVPQTPSALAPATGPFDDIFESPPFLGNLQNRALSDIGHEIGSYWAVKIDALLRLRATAPKVSLKTLYEQHLRDNGIDVERDANALSSVSPAAKERLLAAVNSRIELGNAGPKTLASGIDAGFAEALTGSSPTAGVAGQPNAAQPSIFEDYVARLRDMIVPADMRLALVTADDGSAPLPGAGLAVPDRAVLTTDAPGTSEMPGAPFRRTLGYSSDGFRPLLATQVRSAPRKAFSHFADWVFGGESTLGQLGTILFLLAASAAVAGFAWFGGPRPAIAAPSVATGDMTCDISKDPAGTAVMDANGNLITACQSTSPAAQLATTSLSMGCYVGVLRIVLPASTDHLTTSTTAIAPPSSHLDAQCLSLGLKPLELLNTISVPIASQVTAPPAMAVSEDGRVASRVLTIGSMSLKDVVWVGYNKDQPTISLENPWRGDFFGTNTVAQIDAYDLCVDIGIRMQAMVLADPAVAAEQVRDVVADDLANNVQYMRFRFGGSQDSPVVMADFPLLGRADTTVPFTDPAAGTVAAGTFPLIPEGLLTNADGTSRQRLIGSCL